MCYAHSHEIKGNQWMIVQINSEWNVCVNLITNHYETEICNKFPAYHSITGCDTTFYPADFGKVKPLKKIIKLCKEDLLADLVQSCSNKTVLKEAMIFFRTIIYPGKDKKTVTQTRCRLYLKQKTKSSTNLIPDEGSLMEHLKQTYIWK